MNTRQDIEGKGFALTLGTNMRNNTSMAASKDRANKAAHMLAALIQGHMDEAGLSVAQREKNVRRLESTVTVKRANARETTAAPVPGAPARGMAALG